MPVTAHIYGNAEIKVLWEPAKCIHAAICFKGLPLVFDPRRRPWVEIDNADAETIRQQVGKCPGSALSLIENAVSGDKLP